MFFLQRQKTQKFTPDSGSLDSWWSLGESESIVLEYGP